MTIVGVGRIRTPEACINALLYNIYSLRLNNVYFFQIDGDFKCQDYFRLGRSFFVFRHCPRLVWDSPCTAIYLSPIANEAISL
jgi:hypothetical protein